MPSARTACRTCAARARAIFTNNPPSGAFRGFGVPQAAIAQRGADGRLADARGHRPAGVPPSQRAARRRRHGDAARCSSTRAGLRRLPRGAAAALGGSARAEAAAFNARGGPRRRGVGIACMWYGIGNTAMSNPSTHAGRRSAPDGRAGLLQRRASISARAATPSCRRSPPMRSACRWRDFAPGAGRHRPHRRCRQDLGLAPDLRLAARRREAAGARRCASRSCCLRQCRAGRERWRSTAATLFGARRRRGAR